jgi:hypothetical protein
MLDLLRRWIFQVADTEEYLEVSRILLRAKPGCFELAIAICRQ